MAEGQMVATDVPCGDDNVSANIATENQLLDNLPACRHFLVPNNIILDLLIMFEESETPLIRENLLLMEESDRVEAVNNLMGEVLAHGEDGFNLLLNALRGETGGRELLNRLKGHSPKVSRKNYILFSWTPLKGMYRKISEGELKAILLKLETKKVLKRTDLEQARLKLSRDGEEKATQFMITCLRRSGDNWAWELFFVLVQVKPDLFRKMDPLNGYSGKEEKRDDGDEKEKRSCSSQKSRASSTGKELVGRVSEDHETSPSWTGAEGARDRSPQTPKHRTEENFDDSGDFSDSEEKYSREESEKPQLWRETELKKPQL